MISMQDGFDPYGRPPTFIQSRHSDSPDSSPQPYPRLRQDSAPLLMLPAPLAVSSNQHTSSVSSSLADSMSGFPGPDAQPNYRLHRAPDDPNMYTPDYSGGGSERDPILMSPSTSENIISPTRGINALNDAVIRHTTGGSSYPDETPNPYRNSQHHTAAYENMPNFQGYSAEVVDETPVMPPPRQRGVSLIDPGPVVSPDGASSRRTTRSAKRSSATILSASSGGQPRYKHQSLPPTPVSPPPNTYLPPGAAPPQPQQNNRY
jgi:chitin synthase